MDAAFKVGKVITVDRSKTPKVVQVNIGKTTPAMGQIDETLLFTHTGFVTFPDENNKKYSFWYYPVDGKLYWTKEKTKGQAYQDIWVGETDPNSKFTEGLFITILTILD